MLEYCRKCGSLLCEKEEGFFFCPFCLGTEQFTEEDEVYIYNLTKRET